METALYSWSFLPSKFAWAGLPLGRLSQRRPIHALTCRSDRCFTRSNPELALPASVAVPLVNSWRIARILLCEIPSDVPRPACRGGGEQDRARSSGVGFYETKAPSD